ncbi:MAG: 2-phospho-L-lactate guanylyltransferase [Acidimicrobiia bacterium]
MQLPLIAIPVKPFGVAKRRLSPVLDAKRRSVLGREVAARTMAAARATGAPVAVVTADAGVKTWARSQGVGVITDPGQGLSAAARAAVAAAGSRPWVILHADLPLIAPGDLELVIAGLKDAGSMIAPSYNGGTSVLAGRGAFPFRYGPASFRRHLAMARPSPVVVVRVGLAIDLDGPSDLAIASRHPRGVWLADFL